MSLSFLGVQVIRNTSGWQDEDHETPMQPITIMRNSLGREEGGSGVPIDRKAYEESVAYWDEHAPYIGGSPQGE